MEQASLAFVGAGALGQSYAAAVAAAGRPVVLLATPRGAAALRDAGAIRLRGRLTMDVPVAPAPAPPGVVGITTDPADLPARAGLIFCTKAHQLAGAMADVRRAWPGPGDTASWVAGVQNGVLKDELLATVFGWERVVGAATLLGAGRAPDGSVEVTSNGGTLFGEFPAAPTVPGDPAPTLSERAAGAAQALTDGGLVASAVDDARCLVWSKAAGVVASFGVGVLARVSAPRMLSTPHLLLAGTALAREVAAIAAALGVELRDYPNFFPCHTFVSRSDEECVAAARKTAEQLAQAPAQGPETLASMLQDLLAGRSLEVEEVFGDLVQRAERAGVPVPRLTLVRDLIRGIDPGASISAHRPQVSAAGSTTEAPRQRPQDLSPQV